ncbi:hypothetical protein D3C86_350700 [compost metagenome]
MFKWLKRKEVIVVKPQYKIEKLSNDKWGVFVYSPKKTTCISSIDYQLIHYWEYTQTFEKYWVDVTILRLACDSEDEAIRLLVRYIKHLPKENLESQTELVNKITNYRRT